MEKTCLDCNEYLPATMDEPTEFGICLKDEDFEPFLEELLEGVGSSSCRALVEQKKFVGYRPTCPDFQEAECIEIDDDSPLGRQLRSLAERGELTAESVQEAILEEQARQVDWETLPVGDFAERLKSTEPEERDEAIETLGGLVTFGNQEAFHALLEYLSGLPVPTEIHEVHLKREVLRHLSRAKDKTLVVPYLIEELRAVPSNNTTRQWISDIFLFLKHCPLEVIREPLEKMLEEKKVSPRFKKKVKETIGRRE